MLYQEMVATLPDEALPQIQNKLAAEFDEKQLPNLIEKAKLKDAAALDAELRKFGSSIEKQRQQFAEQILARELIRQKVDKEPEVSHLEMLDHYRENQKDYEREARVRWEEVCVWFKDFNSKSEAYREIANMGNRVLRGAAFSRVAREQSKGYTASDGGWHDWTTKGSLKAKELDEAIFTLPIDQLSQIIETEDGFHIIRVLDREDAGRVPFFKEQVRIKQELQKEKRDKQVDEFLAQLQSRTRVWTIFDDGAEASSGQEQ
jgi:parvulin-like peptidyl-prolyl isomerase